MVPHVFVLQRWGKENTERENKKCKMKTMVLSRFGEKSEVDTLQHKLLVVPFSICLLYNNRILVGT
jgi:hypothetical protein